MNLYKVTLGLTTGATYNMNLYKVTLGLTTGTTYNMTNVQVFKAAQARRAYFFYYRHLYFVFKKYYEETPWNVQERKLNTMKHTTVQYQLQQRTTWEDCMRLLMNTTRLRNCTKTFLGNIPIISIVSYFPIKQS